jgi:thymidylate synthase ThyX
MKMVDPSATLHFDPNPYRMIEWAGRTCYQSESNETSSVEFFHKLAKRGHHAMFEHATFIFDITMIGKHYEHCFDGLPFFHTTHEWVCWGALPEIGKARYLVSTNLRALVEALNASAIRAFEHDQVYERTVGGLERFRALGYLMAALQMTFGHDIHYDHEVAGYAAEYNVSRALFNRSTEATPFVRVLDILPEDYTESEMRAHLHLHYKLVCDRGVGEEMLRHRPSSYAKESTRYCNYGKEKFGSEITTVKPIWWDDMTPGEMLRMGEALGVCEKNYVELTRDFGMPAQKARFILPLGLKGEFAMTANAEEFSHIFDLREREITGPAHPDMKHLATLMHSVYRNIGMKYDL